MHGANGSGDHPTLEAGAPLWVQQFSGDGYPSINDVAFDGAGNIIVVGTFDRRFEVAGAELTGAGDADAFVAKLTAQGALAWAKSYGGPGIDAANAVATTADGDILVAGSFHQSLDVGGTPLTAVSGPDLFVARLGGDGATRWARAFGGTGTALVQDLATDSEGNAVVAGYFDEGLSIDGTDLESAGMQDAFVAKLGTDGALLWARAAGGPTTDSAESVAVNSRGEVVVTGYFRQTASFGSIELSSSSDKTDAFLATLSGGDGTPRWAKSFGGSGYDAGYAVAVDASDNIVLAGTFDEPVLFGGGPLAPVGDFDVVLGKYDVDGAHIWSRRLGGDGNEAVGHVAVSGHVILVSGDFEGRARFGGDPLVSAGLHDGFVAKYSAAGAPMWARSFGGDGQDQLGAIAARPDGAVAVIGSFHRAADFGDKHVEATGLYELVLFRLTP